MAKDTLLLRSNKVYPCYGALRAQCAHYSYDVTIGVGKLSEPPYFIAHVRTTSRTLPIDRSSTGLSRDVTQLSRDVTTVIARCVQIITRCIIVIARCITVIARCVTVIAQCITVVARCVTVVARDVSQLSRDASNSSRDVTHFLHNAVITNFETNGLPYKWKRISTWEALKGRG